MINLTNIRLIVALSAATAFTACKKTYSCACTFKTTQVVTNDKGEVVDGPYVINSSTTSNITAKKNNAEEQCTGSNGDIVQTSDMGDGETLKQTITTNCSIQ